jgi:tetratricopeptide (TPR) repeat protein
MSLTPANQIPQQSGRAEALHSLGVNAYQIGNLEEAITHFRQALDINPNYAEVHNDLGAALKKQGKLKEACVHYQQAINYQPDAAIAHYNMGVALQQLGSLREAVTYYQQAINIDPDFIKAYLHLGEVCNLLDKPSESINYYQRILALHPGFPGIYQMMGIAFQKLGKLKEAISCFDRALELNPDDAETHHFRGCALLAAGDLGQGFLEFQWGRKDFKNFSFSQPYWDGSNLEGKTILLHAELGFGDTVQFIRYAPLVAQRGGQVIVACQKPLVRLLATMSAIKQVIAQGESLPEFQVHLPFLSLPRILGTTTETVPNQVPYLIPPESDNFRLAEPSETCVKVGIVWAGTPRFWSKYEKRSCAITDFQKLLDIPGTRFYSLQKGPRSKDLAELDNRELVEDLSNQLGDFADTAAAIAQLDLVITVDTAVAHLAGALNHPVWVLLPFSPEWRWMLGREDSPWYPSMRLFRQDNPSDWTGVFAQVAEALRALADQRRHNANSIKLIRSLR